MAKLITVFGATGAQGTPVVKALVAKGFQVRAVTRNPDSDKAKALKAAGAEVVKANLDDTANVEAAVQGAYGVFLVTDFWGVFAQIKDPEKAKETEIAQGKRVADVCKKAGVKHLVYSGLAHAQKLFGKSIPHFDGKGIVEEYLDEAGIPNTSVRYPFYYENFLTFFKPEKHDDGTYSYTTSMDGPLYAMTIEDGGPVVAQVFSNPDEFIGKKIGISGDKRSVQEYMDILTKVTKKTFKHNQVPTETFAHFPFPGADELAVMWEFFTYEEYFKRDIDLTKRLNPATRNFEQWAKDNKSRFDEF